MLTCVITSPSGTVRHEGLKSVSLPGLSGRMQILAGHAEAFIVVKKGTVTLEHAAASGAGGKENIEVPECECHVRNNEVVILN